MCSHISAAHPPLPQPDHNPGAARTWGHQQGTWGHCGPWQTGREQAGGGDTNARAVSAVSPGLLRSKRGTSGCVCSAHRSHLSSLHPSEPATNSRCEMWAGTQTQGLSRARVQPCVHVTAQFLPCQGTTTLPNPRVGNGPCPGECYPQCQTQQHPSRGWDTTPQHDPCFPGGRGRVKMCLHPAVAGPRHGYSCPRSLQDEMPHQKPPPALSKAVTPVLPHRRRAVE